MLSMEDLAERARKGEVDTVLVVLIDMQGRLAGKRFHVASFLSDAHVETHCCDYLLATDLEMATPDGYASSSWERGYGDYTMVPDLGTLRMVPWLDATAIVFCDVMDHATHAPVAHAPRQILKRQVERASAMGFAPMMATELEFFLFESSYDGLRKAGYRDLAPISGYNDDYSILQTNREEPILRATRNHLVAAGIPVESSKGEAETGQQELNVRYAEAVIACDHHVLAKHAIKDLAHAEGRAASFMAKWRADKVGSAAHIHQSLAKDGENAFYDADGPRGMSRAMQGYVAGLMKYSQDQTFFLAPYVNSYKRFQPGTFAPTKIAWSVDNRTAGYRLVGEGTRGVRIECRIPGADMNPYLAAAAQLAAGLAGIEEDLSLGDPVSGDVYGMTDLDDIPMTLAAATEALRGSTMLRAAFGDEVVDHYVRAAEVEQEDFDLAVTDYELRRGFERA